MPPAYRRQVGQLAEVLGLASMLRRPVRSLSGGTRRKLEIVRALMHRPPVLFLDEPTVGLDPESRRNLWAYLREVRDRDGTTLFLTTHYLQEAESADEVCVLLSGRIVERGTPAAVTRRQLQPHLVVDAPDRVRLRRELAALGLRTSGTGPLRADLDGRAAQAVIRAIGSDLTTLRIVEPDLEQAYLQLLAGRAR
jgi:ABC-2 type transport system ATP-binding protein